MGRRATGTVEPLRTAIRLKFTWNRARCVETLDLAPTPANLKAAERLLHRVVSAIEANAYRPADFFHRPGEVTTDTFSDAAEAWLDTLTNAKVTKRTYKTAIRCTWTPAFGDKRLSEIVHSDIKRAIAARAAQVSNKSVNQALIPLRGIFKTAIRDGLLSRDPCEGIENLTIQAPEPDPFEYDEMETVLDYMRQRFPDQVVNYFEFAFQTGMRPSEIIALQWGDIDLKRNKARVQRAVVDWQAKGTKSNRVRDVDLSSRARAALKAQKIHTFVGRDHEAKIFHNPITNRPWPDEQVQRRRYFNPTLKALGLRHRDAYQCRHTYASLALMGDLNIAYIAKQMGHANVTMTLTKYARWIDGADKGTEADKLDRVLSGRRKDDELSTKSPRAPEGD